MHPVAQHAHVALHVGVGERDQPEIEVVEHGQLGHDGDARADRDRRGDRAVFVRFKDDVRHEIRLLEPVGKLPVDDRVVRDRDELLVAYLRKRDRLARGKPVRRGDRQKQLLTCDRQVVDRIDVGLSGDQQVQRTVQQLFDQHARHALMEAERGLAAAVMRVEPVDERRQHRKADAVDIAEVDDARARRAQLLQSLLPLRKLRKRALCVGQKLRAVGGQRDLLAALLEQRHVEFLFELGERIGQARLRNVQKLRGARVVQNLRGHTEITKLL